MKAFDMWQEAAIAHRAEKKEMPVLLDVEIYEFLDETVKILSANMFCGGTEVTIETRFGATAVVQLEELSLRKPRRKPQLQPEPQDCEQPGCPEPPDDDSADAAQLGARLLFVVDMMHSGHCPSCGYIGPAGEFQKHYTRAPGNLAIMDHVCPACGFKVAYDEAVIAHEGFSPLLAKCLKSFEEWRQNVKSGDRDHA